jgi:hypothetical protein
VVGGAVDASVLGAQVWGAGRAVTSEVSGIEDKSGRTGDAPSDGWVPSGGSVTGNAVIQGIEIRGAGRAVA